MNTLRLPQYAAAWFFFMTLTACGGSGSNSPGTSASSSSSGGGADTGGSSSGGSGTTTSACGTNTTNTGQLVISTTTCQPGVQGSAYGGCTIAASGGTPPYSYCVATAAANPPLPEGMVLNSTTGIISSTLIGGQGYYGTKIIVTDSASPNNMATQVIGFSIQGNNAFLSGIFASDSIFHHRIDSLPVDTSPAAAMNAPSTTHIQPNFGNLFNTPWPFGMPAISVPYSQTTVAVTTTLYNSGFTLAPIPSYAPVEAWNGGNTDRHVIVYQRAGGALPGSLYEMYQGTLQSNGSWTDSSNAVWTDVIDNVMTPLAPAVGAGTTLASGLPNAATIVNADEVIGSGTPSAPAGSVQHPIRLVLAHVLDYYVWPATTTSNMASSSTCSKSGVTITAGTRLSQSAPPTSCAATGPFGQMYRLKSSVVNPSCAASSPQASIIITGLREYGVIIGDISTDGGLWGTPDSRWNDYDLACLQQLTLGDFEPVNVSSLMIAATSFQTQ